MSKSLLPLLAVAVAAAGCHENPVELAPAPATQSVGELARATGPMGAMDPVSRLLSQRDFLELSGDQIARLESIQSRLAVQTAPLIAQLEELRPEGAARPWHALRLRAGKGRDRMHELTAEQREQLRARLETHRERMRDLTAEQRAELRDRFEARRGELRERHPDMAGSSEEAQARREVMRERMEQLRPTFEQLHESRRQAMDEAHGVLTDEQRARLETRRDEFRRELRERAGDRRAFRSRIGRNAGRELDAQASR